MAHGKFHPHWLGVIVGSLAISASSAERAAGAHHVLHVPLVAVGVLDRVDQDDAAFVQARRAWERGHCGIRSISSLCETRTYVVVLPARLREGAEGLRSSGTLCSAPLRRKEGDPQEASLPLQKARGQATA